MTRQDKKSLLQFGAAIGFFVILGISASSEEEKPYNFCDDLGSEVIEASVSGRKASVDASAWGALNETEQSGSLVYFNVCKGATILADQDTQETIARVTLDGNDWEMLQ